jgi:tRNA modification GTPase
MKSISIASEKLNEGSIVVTNLRHYEAIKNALDNLSAAQRLIDSNSETELIASDLRSALQHIGSIIGKVTTDDILNHIFSKFCIGK